MLDKDPNTPKAFNSHKTTPMTTTILKIDLILLSMGIKRLTIHRTTPITIRINNTFIKGIFAPFLVVDSLKLVNDTFLILLQLPQ
jgi:hypothetical protein